jgi:hypothetical protein
MKLYAIAVVGFLLMAAFVLGGGRSLSAKLRTLECEAVLLSVVATEACAKATPCTVDRDTWLEYGKDVRTMWVCLEEGEYDEQLDGK